MEPRPIMNIVWILVCDSSRGRIFEAVDGDAAWRVIDVVGHAESRSKASELVSDHSGRRAPQGASTHHNALAPSSDPKEVEKGRFVHSLATRLDQAMHAKLFHRWVLVAPPHVLGMLRSELTPEVAKRLLATVDKDLTHFDASELTARLHETIRIPPDQRELLQKADKHAG
jgi:protein required for attachment to host cells